MAKQTERKEKAYGLWDKAWHPVIGCDETLSCAQHCWAKRTCHRLAAWGSPRTAPRNVHRQVMSVTTNGAPVWNGTVVLNEAHLLDPHRWRRPATVATGFHGDLFLLPGADIASVFHVIAKCPAHTFFLLTKRPRLALEFLQDRRWRKFGHSPAMGGDFYAAIIPGEHRLSDSPFLPNVRIGTSASTQPELEARMEPLMKLQAAGWRTFLMLEPLLGPVDVSPYLPGLDLVIVGGESGPGARPMHPDWVRKVRDQCQAAGVPFTFKQWGEWLPADQFGADGDKPSIATTGGARVIGIWPDGSSNGLKGADGYMEAYRVGKRNAGRLLDGRTWDGEMR